MLTLSRRGHFFNIEIMRKSVLFFAALSLSLLLHSCNTERRLIEESALGYLDAMGNYRIKEAEAYATPETVEGTLRQIEKYIMPNLDSAFLTQNTPATIVINDVSITSDTTAEVSYTKTTPIQVQDGKLDMRKRGREWKAQVKIQIPETLKIEHKVDTKALEEKYKGKLRRVKEGEEPPASNHRMP